MYSDRVAARILPIPIQLYVCRCYSSNNCSNKCSSDSSLALAYYSVVIMNDIGYKIAGLTHLLILLKHTFNVYHVWYVVYMCV